MIKSKTLKIVARYDVKAITCSHPQTHTHTHTRTRNTPWHAHTGSWSNQSIRVVAPLQLARLQRGDTSWRHKEHDNGIITCAFFSNAVNPSMSSARAQGGRMALGLGDRHCLSGIKQHLLLRVLFSETKPEIYLTRNIFDRN
jgi:hypothetical protein